MIGKCCICAYGRRLDENGDEINGLDEKPSVVECNRFPPQMMVVPVQNHLTGEAGMSVQGFRPRMNPEAGCGEYVTEHRADA